MNDSSSLTLSLRASGSLACFTRPELKVERVSYTVPTPSAARGILEAVLWKPAIVWRVERIKVLKPEDRPPVEWIAFRRNEVKKVASLPAAAVVKSGGSHKPLIIEDERAQRNTVALRDVDYVIEAHFELTDKAMDDDNVPKFVDMFRRRIEKGQYFHAPYLGCREFAAEIRAVDDETPAPRSDFTADLGIILWDIEYGHENNGRPRNRPRFFSARVEGGVLEVPVDPEATLPNHVGDNGDRL